MGVVQRFERRVEQMVNGAFARAFKSGVQPVEIVAALQRECDDRAAIVSRDRTMAPNVFTVELSRGDHERLSVYSETLCQELATAIREHAAEQGYTLVGDVKVHVRHADDLDTGVFRVSSRAIAGTASVDLHRSVAPGGMPYLEVNGSRYGLTTPVTVIGRGSDADVRIEDPGVSRRHAAVQLPDPGSDRADRALVTDLGSTNGVLVHGRRMPRVELRDGESVVLGNTAVVFRSGAR